MMTHDAVKNTEVLIRQTLMAIKGSTIKADRGKELVAKSSDLVRAIQPTKEQEPRHGRF